jgi:hypothetical protein
VEHTRDISEKSMVHNGATPDITVDPETHEVPPPAHPPRCCRWQRGIFRFDKARAELKKQRRNSGVTGRRQKRNRCKATGLTA